MLKFDFDDGLLFQCGKVVFEGLLRFQRIIFGFHVFLDLLKGKRVTSLTLVEFDDVESEFGPDDPAHLTDIKT